MTHSGPFAKRPSAQYAKPEFYWRGGDVLREREYLADEYKKALADHRKAEYEYKQIEKECLEASQVLSEREKYTSALANFLDADAEGGQIEAEKKRRLNELENEIKEAEAELNEARAVHHPAVASGLQKEKAYLLIEIQRGSKAIDLATEQHDNARRQLAACTVSNRYRQATELEGQYHDLSSKRNFLRSLVNKYKKEFDSTRPCAPSQTKEARLERAALMPQIDLDITIERGEEKKQRRPKKWDNRISRIIDEIDELNDRLTDLGLPDEVVDTEALREKYFPSKEKENAENENNENENEEED
ncbi:Psp-related protein [Tritrichomonas foetus]|uniref:Psp-related protein n=1 Tax=Tritrichomonas foetus TaxID=1144522 RepID=A0A1J4JC97_9EUKA|nr:Psp-related protein [Tritrichomonas foetus]|eukprot:OHS95275.1 Psp-related protein [Tritrichomonas foetus]